MLWSWRAWWNFKQELLSSLGVKLQSFPLHTGLVGGHPFHHSHPGQESLFRNPFYLLYRLSLCHTGGRALLYLMIISIRSCIAFYLKKETQSKHHSSVCCATLHSTIQVWLCYPQYQSWLLTLWGMIPLPREIKITLNFSHNIRESVIYILPSHFWEHIEDEIKN